MQQVAKAIEKDFSILILNPNEPGIESNTPEEHLIHVFDHFISKSPAKYKFLWYENHI